MIMINKRIIAITAVLAFSLNALTAQGRFEYGEERTYNDDHWYT